jgi:hypothetical protein
MAFEPSDAGAVNDAWSFFKQLAEAKQSGQNPGTDQLKEMGSKAQQLVSIADRYPAELNEAYQRFLSGSQLSDAQKQAFSQKVEAAGGFASWFRREASNAASG